MGWLAAAVSLASVLVIVAPAHAQPPRSLSFSLRNGDGYQVTVTGFGPSVALAVHRPKRPVGTTYLVHGKVTRNSIQAVYPGLGRIDVHFRPAQPTPKGNHPRCNSVVRGLHGVFAGQIRFRGEDDYTTVEAHRAKGRLIDFGLLRHCSGGISSHGRKSRAALIKSIFGSGGPEAKTTRVLAEWKQPLGGVFFEATRVGRDHAEFFAVEQHTVGRLAVLHVAHAEGSEKRLASDPALSFASVSPPAPFGGSADLRHGPDGRKLWTGTLTASFPGAPDVALTGADFKTVLARSWGPLPTVPQPLPKRLLGDIPKQLLLPGL
ncbi:MAG: hypothetical protein ABW065_01095 [Solirubrobacterales bacterium]